MTNHNRMRTVACIAALFAGGAAHAEVTAEQVWADWKQNFAIYGEDSISIGSERLSGGTLTVSDMEVNFADAHTSIDFELGDIIFTERRDGTVAVTMENNFPMVVNGEDGLTMAMTVSQSGLEIVASGTPDEMTYTIEADRYTVAVDEIVDGDETITGDMRMIASNLDGIYTTTTGEMRNITYGMTMVSADMIFNMEMPDSPGDYIAMSGKIEDMRVQGNGVVANNINVGNPSMFFANGTTVDGGYAFDRGTFIFDMNADGSQMAGSATTGSGALSVAVDQSVGSYDVAVNGVDVSVSGAAIPFPIEFGMAKYGIGFTMPLAETEEPADFGMRLNLIDLHVSDMIWGMVDRGGVLPHDPATFQLDIAGKARLFFDIFDPDQAATIDSGDTPGEVNSLALNNLRLAIAGALVTGQGDFVFDNTDFETFDGMPRPEGEVNLQFNGINGLMNNLVTMGLLPQEQAMMGQMMMGMFAQATGDDQMSSKIEINDQGHVIANGQRVQ